MSSINIYDTRTMLSVLEDRIPARTFMRTKFFGPAGSGRVFNTEEVDIDVIKGKRRMSPFVNPNHQGKLVEKPGYKTRTYRPAYVKPKIATTASEILKRQPGNILYSPNSGPSAMAAQQLGRELADLDDMIIRREEWMVMQALLTGQIHIKGEGVDEYLYFYMDDTQLPILTGTAKWTDHTNATPLDDLKTWKRSRAKYGMTPSFCLMGLDAWDNFMKCQQVIGTTGGQNLFDMQKVNIGSIDPQSLGEGVTYCGRLKEVGVDIYTYEEWYVDDDDGEEYPMMPANKVFLGNPSARTDFLYGAIKDLDALAPVARFPKQWDKPDPSIRFLMLQSAPLPVPTQIDALLTATVL